MLLRSKFYIIIIITYIYHALINSLSAPVGQSVGVQSAFRHAARTYRVRSGAWTFVAGLHIDQLHWVSVQTVIHNCHAGQAINRFRLDSVTGKTSHSLHTLLSNPEAERSWGGGGEGGAEYRIFIVYE